MRNQPNKLLNNALVTALLGASLFHTPTQAGERESLEQIRATTVNLIDLLVQEGLLSKDKAEALLRKAEAAKLKPADTPASAVASTSDQVDDASANGKSIRVQYVPEHVKQEMRAEIEKEVMEKLNYKAGERLALPGWIDRIEWTGDLRLRYQLDQFPDGNAAANVFNTNEIRNAALNNSTEDRERQRVRARFGANIHVNDWVTGGIRFTTGLLQTPVTPNQTEGFSQGKYVFGLDRAFLKMDPKSWLTVVGGRFENPFFSTDLVWDPDLALDGLAATFHPQINEQWRSFTTVGAFPVEEIESSDTNRAGDKWLYAAQTGVQWTSANKSSIKLAAALYDYSNVEGRINPLGNSTKFAATAPVWRQKGNNTFSINQLNNNSCGDGGPCGLASEFKELNFTGQVDIAKFDPVHVSLVADYVKNIGFDKSDIRRRTNNNYKEETDGYQVAITVGHPIIQKRHDWQIFGGYKRLEADAVLDGFTDSNFHLGGTDAKGYFLGAQYGVDTNTWLTARWFSTDEITGLPLSIDTLLIDLSARF